MKTNLRSTILVVGLAFAPVAGITSSAYALSFVSTQAPGEQSTSSIIGLAVENANGDKLGDINYLVLDNAGKISTAVIGVGGFLGVGEKNVGVPYSELKFTEKDGRPFATMEATKDTLKSAPNYTWTEKSAMEKLQDRATGLTKDASNSPENTTTK